jgi:anthranilate phosphoribosyltransferase
VTEEHPFAGYVRILGKGKSGTRSLQQSEARDAFNMILAGAVEQVQLGAFLMLLRVKEESAEELAGFVEACRDHLPVVRPTVKPLLDWSSYAGKKAQHPWYILSALVLAENGIGVLMHGSDGHTAQRLYSGQVFAELGIGAADNITEALDTVDNTGLAWLPLKNFLPQLDELIQLKPLLGLRSPVNTLTRMLNPGRAKFSIQSVFHPAYEILHQQADRLLAQPNALVFKGDGGEVEMKPQAATRYSLLRGDDIVEQQWSRQIDKRPLAVDAPASQPLLDLWRDDWSDAYGTTAVIETCAIALLLLNRANNETAARALAIDLWQQRDKGRL